MAEPNRPGDQRRVPVARRLPDAAPVATPHPAVTPPSADVAGFPVTSSFPGASGTETVSNAYRTKRGRGGTNSLAVGIGIGVGVLVVAAVVAAYALRGKPESVAQSKPSNVDTKSAPVAAPPAAPPVAPKPKGTQPNPGGTGPRVPGKTPPAAGGGEDPLAFPQPDFLRPGAEPSGTPQPADEPPSRPGPAPTPPRTNPRPVPPTATPQPAPRPAPQPTPSSPVPAGPVGADAEAEDAFVDAVSGLLTEKKLLLKKQYPAVRKLFADRFERRYGALLLKGYGEDAEAMRAWFAEHPDVRDEFYLALAPEHDDLPRAAEIFNALRKQFPSQIKAYANLAIAVAIVWDRPRAGVYSYAHHAQRCRAQMPATLMDAVGNFQYCVEAESHMQGRILHVPWEFLVHVVNHQTPREERVWAMQGFAPKRVMFGKCYADVPYDKEMLRTESRVCKLNDLPYTLQNILVQGGVCAMQADFAARVGKSIGVSAEYVRGEAAGGDRHAWVMWVELKQATPAGLVFSLESHGRYGIDKYYVGELQSPQTGQEMTDRDMELRLQMVGLDTVAKRHALLVMQAYPMLCEKVVLEASDRLDLLNQVIQYSPGCEEAWFALARLARDSSGDKKLAKAVQSSLDRLFQTFARVPDFTWKVFGDLAAYYPEGKARTGLYDRLILLYEAAGRPDLACEARLAWADLLVADGRTLNAVQGLAVTIKKFPDDGRYVPRMLDRLEALCQGLKGADQELVNFYTQVLPLIPQTRGSEPSTYAIKMFERAAGVFNRLNQPQLAQAAEAEATKIRSGNGRRDNR